jgi:hypothetical protein
MITLELTSKEREDSALSATTLDCAEKAIREDGFVVLRDVVSHEHLDALWDKMLEDIATILALPEPPHQFVYGNVQQDPPPLPPYIFQDVIENPWVNQISRRVLGEGAYNHAYSGNTNIPGSQLQPVHVDNGDLWPGMTSPQPAQHLVVNIPLKDVTEENGSIELWPGSHLLMSNVQGEDIKVDPDTLAARKETVPPIRGNTERGSVLIRDMRAWHRGTPNETDDPRFMIALVHSAFFMRHTRQPAFSQDACAALAEMNPLTDFRSTDDLTHYLTRHKSYDYPTQGII